MKDQTIEKHIRNLTDLAEKFEIAIQPGNHELVTFSFFERNNPDSRVALETKSLGTPYYPSTLFLDVALLIRKEIERVKGLK